MMFSAMGFAWRSTPSLSGGLTCMTDGVESTGRRPEVMTGKRTKRGRLKREMESDVERLVVGRGLRAAWVGKVLLSSPGLSGG